jgi:hypothetical protein
VSNQADGCPPGGGTFPRRAARGETVGERCQESEGNNHPIWVCVKN